MKPSLALKPKEAAMKTLLMFATAIALLAAAPYAAQAQQTTMRDSRGSTVGTATRSGNTVTFRDSRGSTTGTATTLGNQTTYRNSRGSTIGTSSR
jgi:opacity protein-like surface antigen